MSSKEVDKEELGAIADDSLSIFRIALFFIVIYISIISLAFRRENVDIVVGILNSYYTTIGATFWVGSLTTSLLTYRIARRASLQEEYSQLGQIPDKFIVMNYVTASIIALFLSIISLLFGLYEGWLSSMPTYPNGAGIGIRQPIGTIGLSFLLVMFIFGVIFLVDLIRDRWGPIRKILRMSE
jgi:hypothetical protein